MIIIKENVVLTYNQEIFASKSKNKIVIQQSINKRPIKEVRQHLMMKLLSIKLQLHSKIQKNPIFTN